MRRDVFQAIADPTRRQIINLIAHRSLHLNSVAEKFDVSRPAISKHIKILTECGLIEIRQQGRHRYCEARLEKLNHVSDWVEQYRKFWELKLDALENYLEDLQKKETKLVLPGRRGGHKTKNPSRQLTRAGTKTKRHVTGKRKR
jgi:DNA-binding transcriptional ArsR family regulator